MALAAERWRPESLPEADRLDALLDLISATHLPWSVTPEDDAPAGTDALVRYRIGDLALVDCRCGPCSGHRGRSQMAATDEDAVGVLFVRAGEEHVEVGGERSVLRPGSALVWRSDEPVRFRVPGRLHKWTLLVPRSRFAADVEGGRVLEPAAADLLAGLLGSTLRTAGALDPRLAVPVADAAVGLLAEALPGRVTAEPPPDAAWLRITAYVRANLRDPDLTPERMAGAGYVSLRALYVLFAERGETPARYVRRRRLEAARRELQRRGTGVSVAEVAHGWGFRDSATFSRGFRAAYGLTPDDVRRGACGAGWVRPPLPS
ncbi:helix-turn-helix domain-containing protein [Blastococcus sp. SYSU DS0828]